MNEKPPQHPFEVRINIGGDDWEYVRRAVRDLLEHVESREPSEVGCSSGGGGGCHSIDLQRRDVSAKQFREELQAWHERSRSVPAATQEQPAGSGAEIGKVGASIDFRFAGSGALREAQAKLITELLDVAKSFWPTDAIANSKIGSIAQRLAALSLSSPIEPPCSDCGRAEKAHPNTVCIKFTRPTPQASSEIREAATAYMNAVKEFIANRPDDEQGSQREWSAFEKQRRALYQAEKLLVVALAPSRQGAGEK